MRYLLKMEIYQKKLLAKFLPKLQEELDTTDVTEFLVNKEVLTKQDQEIIEAEDQPSKRVASFLEILKDRGDRAFVLFLEAMKTEYDEIVEMLTSEEKKLKEEFEENLLELVTIIGDSYENFIFWSFLYRITELMAKNEASELCRHLQFDEDTRKSVRKGVFPGLSFMAVCLKKKVVVLQDCSRICDAVLELGLDKLGQVAQEYKKLISDPAFHLSLEGFPAEDDVLNTLKKGQMLGECCIKLYGVRLDTFQPAENTLTVRIPNVEALENLCSDIKSTKFTTLFLQTEEEVALLNQAPIAAATVKLRYEEDEFNNIEKHFSKKAECSVSFANIEGHAETESASSSVFEESGSDGEDDDEDTAGHEETKRDLNESAKISPFGLLLQRVGRDMNMEHCKRVATIIRLPNADFDLMHSSSDLLRMMVCRGEVSEKEVSLLKRLLTEINLQTAVEKIKQYEETYFYGRGGHPFSETGDVDRLTSSHDGSEMPALHKKVLLSIMSKLSGKMDLKAAVRFMLDNHSFTVTEGEEMLSYGNRSEMTTDFVKVLKTKSLAAYELFHEFLVCNYPNIADKMKKEEVRMAENSTQWKIMRSTRFRRLNKLATYSIEEDSIEACASNNMKLSVVLVGKTGSGKSSTGNTILGRSHAFTTSLGFLKSCTKTNHLERLRVGNMVLCVMDTPGLFDTDGKLMDNQSVLLEIAKAVIDFPEGIDVFVIVCRIDTPFTEEEHKSIDKIEERFGREIFQHAILVLTRGSEMRSASLSEHLSPENIPPYLSALIHKVSRKVIVVENKPRKVYFSDLQHDWVIAAICSFVNQKRGPPKYTNEQFNAVQEMIKQDQKKNEDYTCVRNLTTTFVYDFIKKADETTLRKIMEEKAFGETEMTLLVENMRKSNLWNDYICTNINSIIENVITENNLVIDQKLSSLVTERQTKGRFEFQRRKLLLEKILDELKQKQILKANEFFQERLIDYISNSSGDELTSLLYSSDIPNEILEDFNKKRFIFISSKCLNDMSRAALESKKDMIKIKIQGLMKQEEQLTFELHNVFRGLNLRELKFVKQNNDLNEEQQLLLQQNLHGHDYDFKNDDLRKLTRAVIRDDIEKFINMKESQIQEEKSQRRKENLLKMQNIIDNFLFDCTEEATEEKLKSFRDGSYPSENDIMHLMSIVELEEILESDIRNTVTAFLQRHFHRIQDKYEWKRSSRLKLERRINEQREHQRKKDRAREEVIHIADNDAKDFLRKLNKSELNDIKEKLEKNKLPTKLFKEIKDKLSPENMLDDEELREVILSVLNLKKEMLMKIISDNSKGCFPCTSVVVTERAGKIPISMIRVGDKVLSLNSDYCLAFEEIFFMAHSDKHSSVPYLNIETVRKQSLIVSPNHCLPVGHLESMKVAKEISVNDIVYTAEEKNITPDIVTSVRYEFHRGAYCPYTLSGTIVVDNVVASCFTTTFAPKLAQTVLAPMRLMYKYTPLSIYTSLFSTRNMQFVSLSAQKGVRYCEKQKRKNKNVCFKGRMEF